MIRKLPHCSPRGWPAILSSPALGHPYLYEGDRAAAPRGWLRDRSNRALPGVVRWRCRDLVCVVERRFGVSVSEDTIARMLHALGLSHITARPRHPEQKNGAIAGFKKNSRASSKGR